VAAQKKWKFWNFVLWQRFGGAVAPEPWPSGGIFLQFLILRQKLSGDMKNHRRSLSSFWDINGQTFGSSENQKIGEKSAKSQNADLCRKFITGWKWMNFGTVVEGHDGYKISKISEWEILVTHLNNFWSSQLWPQISQKSAPKNFWDFCPKWPRRGCRTRKWPKTGTGSSFRRHFNEKTIFLGFCGDF